MVRKGGHVYVFCAVRGPLSPRDLAKLPTMPGGARPRGISLTGDITLIAADVPADDYRTESIEAHLKDLDWVARCGAAHHGVADALAPKHTIVPFRLFTIFSSEANALSTLSRAVSRIDDAFDRVKGKAEWVLRISKPDPSLASPSDVAPPKGPAPTSGASFLTQKAAAKRAAAQMAADIRRDVAAVCASLADVADQSSERSVEPGTGLLLDAAFLVPARQVTSFKRALEEGAQALLRSGCRVSLTGPWPPYSFVSLETTSTRG